MTEKVKIYTEELTDFQKIGLGKIKFIHAIKKRKEKKDWLGILPFEGLTAHWLHFFLLY